MALERIDFGVEVRKYVVISVKTFHSFICNHQFLVGLVCFLIFLYRSFPLLFSFLVTASSVLVCTAVLLGILLSFGSPNIPEINEHEEENVSHEVSPLKTRSAEDDTVVKRDFTDDDFVVQRHVGKRWDAVDNADEKVTLVDNEVNGVEEGDISVLYKLLVNDDLDSKDIHCENGVVDEVEGLLSHSLIEMTTEIREEMLESERVSSLREAEECQHILADEIGDRNLEAVDCKLTSDVDDGPRGSESDSSLIFSWKCVADNEDAGDDGKDDDEDDESSDSGSGGAESSSPDASLADISLMLDELHPFLGSEATQPAHLSRHGLDPASESSGDSSNDGSVDSDELEDEGDRDNEEEGGEKGDEEDETRKSMRLMAETNLIDLDSADIPLNLAPISTSRGNPFDLPYDSYNDLRLPPIPGSAPSNLQHRRNPFDILYDSSEEKPDLKGDSFQEEFSGFNQRMATQRDSFFSRHESFNVGSSSLVVPRQELKWKPYFVLEQLVPEEASPSLFQRQSSEVSESKLSSVLDTESVSSIVDEGDNKPDKQDVSRETEPILNEDRASVSDEQESTSYDDVEYVDVDLVENRDVHHDVAEITLGDGESQLDIESMSEAGVTTYSEHNDSEAKNRDVHYDEVAITLGDGAPATTHVEFNATEIHPRIEPAEDDDSNRSSLSSLSKRFFLKGEKKVRF
ncbi:Far1-related sequence 3 [Hibiscus syriacus]|uniref:Far1-related sequence 3 n=1 Tax=Hibiscus syriacus TaxID=106335 RepID=A0A6A3C2I3_HIBSY|nr:Far1-related sequence 3 [Hibiscus syriacus]